MTLLSFHIITALLTLTLCALIWVRPISKLFTPLLISSLVSIITGIMVSLDSPILTTCAKLGVYSLVITASLYKLKSNQATSSLDAHQRTQ
ncbi:hypothetical protein KBD69_02785 [Candidatus Woesebacteria bacterium]|nr:hypothetical protein [Candidatus Woesebacteria bacterium]